MMPGAVMAPGLFYVLPQDSGHWSFYSGQRIKIAQNSGRGMLDARKENVTALKSHKPRQKYVPLCHSTLRRLFLDCSHAILPSEMEERI